MRRMSPIIRLLAVLSLAFCFSSASSLSVLAQDDATPSAAEETPIPQEPAVLQGSLTFYVYTCSSGPEGVVGDVYLEGEFTPDETCVEDVTASVSIDGGDAEAVGSGAEYLLDEGDHTVTETNLGESETVAIAEQAPAAVYVVFYSVAEEQGEPAATGSILITKHICPEEIQTQDDFDLLGDFYAKIQACLTITWPGDLGPDGALNANDPENPLGFDFEVADGVTTQAIDAAAFTAEQLCESGLGQDINGDVNDDLCLDESNYGYEGVVQGAVTVTEITPPDGYAYGALEFIPESGDDATLVSASTGEGIVELDTTGDDNVVLHVFNFQKPPENQILVIKHQCKNIESVDDFDATGDFFDKWQECPAVTRNGDDGPDDAVDGGHGTFDFDVEGSDGTVQTIAGASFVSDQLCESDLGEDINDDPNDDLCLSSAGYLFQNVIQGPGVLVTETKSPANYHYGSTEFDPESGDDASLVDASDDGVIELDTTLDGGIVLHVFNLKTPVDPTPEPSPYGSVQVLKFFCVGDVEETFINVLAPGDEATADDWGDSTCVAGQADFAITAFGTDELEPFSTNADGQITITELWVTDGSTGPHVITELYSGAAAEFDVDPDTVTRIIVFNYEVEVTDEEAIDDAVVEDDSSDEETILSGEDLAETGTGSMGTPAGGGMVLMLAVMGLLVIGCGAVVRRRTA